MSPIFNIRAEASGRKIGDEDVGDDSIRSGACYSTAVDVVTPAVSIDVRSKNTSMKDV